MDVTQALIHILLEQGVTTIYGVAGDYALGLFDRFDKCPDLELVCTAGEEAAAFAADAQAQLTGRMGVCLVTYGVGALKLVNPVAGAYAEQSRVLVLSAAPGMVERLSSVKLHHVHKQVDTQLRIFQEVCAAVGEVSSVRTAVATIQRVLDAMHIEARPGLLQIPRDMMAVPLCQCPITSLSSSSCWRWNPRKRPWEGLVGGQGGDETIMSEQHQNCHKKRPVHADGEPKEPSLSKYEMVRIPEVYHQTALQVLEWMRHKTNPMVIVGLEIPRFQLQDLLQRVLEHEQWHWAESLLAKDTMPQPYTDQLCVGLYAGAMSAPHVRQAVESSNGILLLGLPLQSDLDSGMNTSVLMNASNNDKVVQVSMEAGLEWQHGANCRALNCVELLQVWTEALGLRNDLDVGADAARTKPHAETATLATTLDESTIKRQHHTAIVERVVVQIQRSGMDQFKRMKIEDLLKEWNISDEVPDLVDAMQTTATPEESVTTTTTRFVPRPGQAITVKTLMDALNVVIAKHSNATVLVEAGDPMMAASELRLTRTNHFLNNGYWASLGFALPGAIGAWYADKTCRPVVLIGDGAFLTCCNELATLVRYRIPAVIVIFDNKGYGTLRPMLDGTYNNVQPVNHVSLANGFGCKWARRVWSEKEVWESLCYVFDHEALDGPCLISVMLDSNDISIPLKTMCHEMGKRVKQQSV